MKTNRDLWERALAFMDAQTLLTAHDLGLFDALADKPMTAEELAGVVRLPAATCSRLLAMLAALELVERTVDGTYVNAPEVEQGLVRGRPEYVGGLFTYVRKVVYPAWSHLDRALTQNAPQCHGGSDDGTNLQEAMFQDVESLRPFLAGMHAVTYASAVQFAGYAPEQLNGVRSLIDVGGATGAFLIALAERHALCGTVFDLPAVVQVAGEFIQAAGLSQRLQTVAGDFWQDPIPAGADAYGLGFILHDWDEAGGDIILDKIRVASSQGATLIVGEHLLDPTGTGPLFAVRQDLNMLVTARGRERTEAEYACWLRRHGFAVERAYGCAFGKYYLCARRI